MPKFDFEANKDILLGIILGDVSLGDYQHLIKVLLGYKYDTFQQEVVASLMVKVDSDRQEFICREALSLRHIEDADMEREVWRVYHGMARKMSFRLFEFDPRIGLPMNDSFPDCPLFDPPYIVGPYSHYLALKPIPGQVTPKTREVTKTLTTCPFCLGRSLPFGGSLNPAVWCGGNVGFAHEACAPWVTPRH
jgi:hypothetical protein